MQQFARTQVTDQPPMQDDINYNIKEKVTIMENKDYPFQLTATCLFGIEAVLKNEIKNLGYPLIKVDDGRITFAGDSLAICRSQLWLRTAERVLLDVGNFEARTFDELFEQVKALPWENVVPKDGKVWVTKAASVKSKLFSPSDIQSIVKKAIVERLKVVYGVNWLPETGVELPLRVFIKKDVVAISLDMSGDPLHKRGYRELAGVAPISETIAAALVLLSPWKPDRILADPFCGSGTIPIEAAMIGANIAPGLNREFIAENYKHLVPAKHWMEAVDEANDLIKHDVELNVQGFDTDFRIIKVAKDNAAQAGVDKYIHFQERDVADFRSNKKYGVMITNPPYGERMEDVAGVQALYKTLGEVYRNLDSWTLMAITSYEEFERHFGKTADKKRKLYSGMLKTNIYQYMGPKPGRPTM